MPGHLAGVHTCGFSIIFDPDFKNTKCAVIWGLGVDDSFRANYYRNINEALKNGAKLIVIDPLKTSFARKADFWLQIRPGTDCALALGMLNIIINEELYDKEFVEKWTIGFDELKEHVQEFSPKKVSAKSSPSCIGTGIGGLCQNTNVFQANRAIAILAAITGNLDIPGGQINHPSILKDKGSMLAQYDTVYGDLTPEQIKKRLWIGNVVKNDGFLNAHPVALWQAIRENKPYPVKAMIGIATNSVVTKENSKLVRDTLMKLDFFAITELFMTPTSLDRKR